MLIVAVSFLIVLFAVLIAVSMVLADTLLARQDAREATERARIAARIDPPRLDMLQVIPVVLVGDILAADYLLPLASGAAGNVLVAAEEMYQRSPTDAEHDAWVQASDGMAGYEAPFSR